VGKDANRLRCRSQSIASDQKHKRSAGCEREIHIKGAGRLEKLARGWSFPNSCSRDNSLGRHDGPKEAGAGSQGRKQLEPRRRDRDAPHIHNLNRSNLTCSALHSSPWHHWHARLQVSNLQLASPDCSFPNRPLLVGIWNRNSKKKTNTPHGSQGKPWFLDARRDGSSALAVGRVEAGMQRPDVTSSYVNDPTTSTVSGLAPRVTEPKPRPRHLVLQQSVFDISQRVRS
jgi:hypothetical protein